MKLSSLGKCKKGKYKGEKCLIPKSSMYPVTVKSGTKLSCEKVRKAAHCKKSMRRKLKSKGLCSFVKRCGVKTQVCEKKH